MMEPSIVYSDLVDRGFMHIVVPLQLPLVNAENQIKHGYHLPNGTYVGSSASEDDQNGSPFKVPQVEAAPSAAIKMNLNGHPTNGDAAPSITNQWPSHLYIPVEAHPVTILNHPAHPACMNAEPSNMDHLPSSILVPVKAHPVKILIGEDHSPSPGCMYASPSILNQWPSYLYVPDIPHDNGASSSPGKKRKRDHYLTNGTYVGLAPSADDQQRASNKKSSPFKIPPRQLFGYTIEMGLRPF